MSAGKGHPDQELYAHAQSLREQRDTIVRRFEVGRLAQASERSLRELEQSLDRRLSRTYLHRCKMAYRLGRSFPFLLESRRLKVSHLDAVERLPRPIQQRLLLAAESEGWSVRRLRAAALSERDPERTSVVAEAARRALATLSGSLRTLAAEAPTSRAALASLSELQRELEQAGALGRSLLSAPDVLPKP